MRNIEVMPPPNESLDVPRGSLLSANIDAGFDDTERRQQNRELLSIDNAKAKEIVEQDPFYATLLFLRAVKRAHDARTVKPSWLPFWKKTESIDPVQMFKVALTLREALRIPRPAKKNSEESAETLNKYERITKSNGSELLQDLHPNAFRELQYITFVCSDPPDAELAELLENHLLPLPPDDGRRYIPYTENDAATIKTADAAIILRDTENMIRQFKDSLIEKRHPDNFLTASDLSNQLTIGIGIINHRNVTAIDKIVRK